MADVMPRVAGTDQALREDGWTLLPSRLSADLVRRLGHELEAEYAKQRAVQVRNGVGEGTEGIVHHLPTAGGAFLELLEGEHGQGVLADFFGAPYILNTFGGLLNRPSERSYVARIH